MSLSTRLMIIGAMLFAVCAIAIVPYIADELILLVQIVLVSLVVALFFVGIIYGLYVREKLLMVRAKRIEAEQKALALTYQSYTDGFGMVHLLNLKTNRVENLSTYPGSHHNGVWEDPPQQALMAWHALVAKNRNVSEQAVKELVIDQTPVQSLDLLSVFTQPNQSFAIIGGQQVGKTFQAQRIAAYWLQNGIRPVVIGPKWDTGEWPECQLFGGEYNFEAVQDGMDRIQAEAKRRHSSGQPHKSLPILPVFFDDWTAIVAKLPGAEDFVLEALTLYASVNISLYFIIHLDTAHAWGVGKVGAALKNGFIKLFIRAGYDRAGLIDRAQNVGLLMYPGETLKQARQIKLFSAPGQVYSLPRPQPTEEEQKVLDLLAQGRSYREITRAVWGQVGGFYNAKIAEIARKWGEK